MEVETTRFVGRQSRDDQTEERRTCTVYDGKWIYAMSEDQNTKAVDSAENRTPMFLEALYDDMIKVGNLEFVGMRRLAGRDCCVIRGEIRSLLVMTWIDAPQFIAIDPLSGFPIRIWSKARGSCSVIEYSEVSLNQELDDALFVPPEGIAFEVLD
jgi:hypothetical protein